MLGAGYDLGEWTLPPELKKIGHGPAPNTQARKAEAATDPDAPAAGEPAPDARPRDGGDA